MRKIVSALLLTISLTLVGSSIALATGKNYYQLLLMTIKVHHCEEPTWHVNGSLYKGGLGWRPATWTTFRLPWMPLTMNLATIREQVIAMSRFAAKYGWPDQNGCTGGY